MENRDKQLSFKFEKGGSLGAKYITRQQINTITIAGKDANLTYKVSDVLNGAYTLKDGGSLSKFAKYIPLKSIVKVQLRDGKNIKPINGYWLKSTAKPIRISKFEEGGSLDSKRYIISNGKDKGIIVFAENGDEALRKGNRIFYGAYPIKEKLTNVQLYQPNKHQFVSSLGNKKFKYVQHHFSGEGVAGNQTIYDTTIDTKLNKSQLDFIGNAKVDYIKFYDSEKSKFENGGVFNNPNEFIKKEIEKQTLKEKGQNFKKYKVNVYVQDSRGAFPSIEPYFTDNVVEALNFAKETIKKASSSDKKGNTYWATIDRFVPISKRANVIYAYSELERITENDVNSSKYAKGGAFDVRPFEYKERGHTIMINGTQSDIKKMYLDYVNNFGTIGSFADYYNISDDQAENIISKGRELSKTSGTFARGGAIKQSSKIERKVAEVNSLIREAFDNENDPLYVYDPTSTWESPMIYKEVIYKNGRLYIEYYEPHSSFSQIQKEVINKSNMEEDGYPTLLYIAKMYRKAIKKFKSGKYNNEDEDYKNGGNLNNSDDDLKLAYLTDLWFAVHQKESKGYNKIGKELDKLNVPYSVQNSVSDDAFENRGRKNPSVSEVKLFIKKILTKKGLFAKGGSLSTKPKFKVGEMVYSYQNKTEKRPISYIKESSDSTYDHKYKLSLIDGYSNWIDEKSLSNSTMMKDGGSINKSITFKDWKGDIRVGVITEKLPNGYEVLTDNGVALVKDNEIID